MQKKEATSLQVLVCAIHSTGKKSSNTRSEIMSEHTEFLDDLVDVSEMQDALEENFNLDPSVARETMVEWFKELIERYR